MDRADRIFLIFLHWKIIDWFLPCFTMFYHLHTSIYHALGHGSSASLCRAARRSRVPASGSLVAGGPVDGSRMSSDVVSLNPHHLILMGHRDTEASLSSRRISEICDWQLLSNWLVTIVTSDYSDTIVKLPNILRILQERSKNSGRICLGGISIPPATHPLPHLPHGAYCAVPKPEWASSQRLIAQGCQGFAGAATGWQRQRPWRINNVVSKNRVLQNDSSHNSHDCIWLLIWVIVDDCAKIRLPGLSSCIKDHPEYGSINMSMCKRSITNGLT